MYAVTRESCVRSKARKQRARYVLVSAIAAVCVVSISTALIVTSGRSSPERSDASIAAVNTGQPRSVHENQLRTITTDGVVTFAELCSLASFDPTRGAAPLTRAEACAQLAAIESPKPETEKAGMVASYTIRDGQMQIMYHDLVLQPDGSRSWSADEVPPDEAAARIAAVS
jgi:hypothetical protein